MNGTILGIGPLEFLIVIVLVLLIFGPDRLPDLMRQGGKGIRKLREFYVKLSKDLRTELTPFEEEIRVLRDVTQELRHDLNTIREAADIRQIIPPIALDGSARPVPGTANSTANSTAVAAPAEPSAAPATAAATAAPARAPVWSANGAKVELNDDNPWARLSWSLRTDALDGDSPWAA